MKFLIHSNGPNVKTGYGVQCALLADRLANDGHQVAISATFGQPTGMGSWVSPSGHRIPVYPSKFLVSGDDVIHAHAQHFFGNDRNGWIIPLIDVWSMMSPVLSEFNVAAWAPVDHDPVPPGVVKFFDRSKARCIAMSRHGHDQFTDAGLDPTYIPLAVDTKAYKPTFFVDVPRADLIDEVPAEFIADRLHDGMVKVTAREYFKLPEGAFVVGMVGMNKDPNDRKGFVEAFMAFAQFHETHPNAVLFVHSEVLGGGGGLDLVEVADAVGIPRSAVRWTDQYAYLITQPPSAMAMAYTAMDVLLAPSMGEGFCVPLVEAQACGVPVIASDFTAQPELVGAGWLVSGQRWWDQASHSWYQKANVGDIVDCLTKAYDADLVSMQTEAIEFAAQFDADRVYETFWKPYIETLDERPPAVKPKMERVAVLVPAMRRPENVKRVTESFDATNDGTAELYYICDADDTAQIEAVHAARWNVLISDRGTSFASKVNDGFAKTDADWVFICGDDVEFTPGWIAAARALSDRYDVIGTNDSEPGRIRNPKVANGSHADHFFVRRSYVEDAGASLEGPGVLAPEAYFHFYTDMEIIQLAKARGVFTPCLESRVIHHHPGYDGREDLRAADPVYMKAVEFSEMDQIAFKRRAGLIEQHKVVRGDIWR